MLNVNTSDNVTIYTVMVARSDEEASLGLSYITGLSYQLASCLNRVYDTLTDRLISSSRTDEKNWARTSFINYMNMYIAGLLS